NDVDMFAIYIADPATFQAETNTTSTNFDSQLWLFDVNGNGIVHDDDSAGSLRSRITNANNCIPSPGIYYIAISRYNRDPRNCDDNAIWTGTANACAIAGRGRVASWTGTTAAGNYEIVLTGAFTAPLGADPADCPPFDGWDETANGGGDAGDLPATAQLVTLPDQTPCNSPVTRIRGDLEADGVDMYVICITDPASFVASTVGTATWDTQLWLFRCDGTGVVHNDDAVGETVFQSRLDNSANCITEGGVYLLAISRYNRDAVDANGNLLWNNEPFRAVRCADGPGAANSIAGWTNNTAAAGRYIITLQGAYFVSDSGCEQGPGCEGDVNGDGRVDDADLLVVLFNFGCFGFGCQGDVNNDATVDDADLLIVLFNFGCGS
ncbi:MAG: DVUA0089 family protein, partial [Fimbriimonadales bacterium]